MGDSAVIDADDIVTLGHAQTRSAIDHSHAKRGAERPRFEGRTEIDNGIVYPAEPAQGIQHEVALHHMLCSRFQRREVASATSLEHMRADRIDAIIGGLEDLQHPTPLGATAALHANLDQLARECSVDKNDSPVLTPRERSATSDKSLGPNGLCRSSR
jgi:hypothetical protein